MFKKIISQFTIKHVTKVQLIITRGCCSLVSFILHQVSRHGNFRVRSINDVSAAAQATPSNHPHQLQSFPRPMNRRARSRLASVPQSPPLLRVPAAVAVHVLRRQAAAVIVPSSAASAPVAAPPVPSAAWQTFQSLTRTLSHTSPIIRRKMRQSTVVNSYDR